MSKFEQIKRKNKEVAKWLDHLDEDLPVEDNRVHISVESDHEGHDFPLFAKFLNNGINIVDKESFVDEILPHIENAIFNYDIFSGELKATIKNKNNIFKYTFVRNSLKRRNEIWEDLAKKGKLPIKESDYANVFSESELEHEIEQQRIANPNPLYANELEEIKKQMHDHDFDKISGCIAGGVYDGQVWAMVNHAE